MKLKCLGSSSAGNCYILESDTEALIIEAGISLMEVKKALDFQVSKIVGVIVSHSHGDHAKYIAEYERVGIQVWKPYEIAKDMEFPGSGFKIRGFALVHDVPCCGFLIEHPEIGRMIYASDTEYIKYRFKDLNHILVETNYSKELIDTGSVNREHVLTGHMELQTTLDFLRANNNPDLRNVVLLHLSNSNSDEEMFKSEAEKVVDCQVRVAEKGLEVLLDLIPF